MDEFVILARSLDRRSASRCSWSCSASRPSGSAPPSTTRRPATASGRGSAAGSPGTASGSAIVDRASCSSTRRRRSTCSSARATGSGRSSAGSPTARSGIRVRRSASRRSATTAPLPGPCVVPGRAAQLDRDRVHRRGRVPRRAPRPAAHRPASNPTLANLIQAILYTLATRLGRARPRPLPARPDARDRPLGGWLTVADRRDRGRVPRPRDHPLRGLPVHRPRRPDQAARPRGRGDREAPTAARGLAGHRIAGVAVRADR